MKKYTWPVIILLLLSNGILAQPQLPKHEISKPQATVQLLQLSNVIIGKWKGARLIQNTGSVTVDSLWLEFKKDGTLTFKHQQYEFNGPVTAAYTINKNTIRIIADKFPFKHTLQGAWDINTGIINGNFHEARERDTTQPTYYSPGTTTGNFNLTRY